MMTSCVNTPTSRWAGSPTKAAGTAELPSGTVTFLFTDVEGSTRLWEEYPEVMRDGVGAPRRAVARRGRSHTAAMSSRRRVTGSTRCSRPRTTRSRRRSPRNGRSLLSEWDSTEPVRVRMGIHTGEAEVRDGDYYGPAVNRAARLMSVAHGGQVVVSLATEELLHDSMPEHCGWSTWVSTGCVTWAGPSGCSRCCIPIWSGSSDRCARWMRSRGTCRCRRARSSVANVELARVAEALETSRVVSLTGVGGVGKTRLALQVAAEVLPDFRHGAWLVELARVRDPNVVVDAVAAVFGVTPRAGCGLVETLAEFLRPKELLLVLDNCEHLLGAVVDLVRTLEARARAWWCLRRAAKGWVSPVNASSCVPSLALPGSDERDVVLSSEAVRLVRRSGGGGQVGLRGDRRERGGGRRGGAAPRWDPVGVGVGGGPHPGAEPGAARATAGSAFPCARRWRAGRDRTACDAARRDRLVL